jgi:hypothetical protein
MLVCLFGIRELLAVKKGADVLSIGAGRLPGSLPGFLSGTNGTPSANATGGPNINPRASKPVKQRSAVSLGHLLAAQRC